MGVNRKTLMCAINWIYPWGPSRAFPSRLTPKPGTTISIVQISAKRLEIGENCQHIGCCELITLAASSISPNRRPRDQAKCLGSSSSRITCAVMTLFNFDILLTESVACVRIPCQHGGTCYGNSSTSAGFSCICPTGFSGATCEGQ